VKALRISLVLTLFVLGCGTTGSKDIEKDYQLIQGKMAAFAQLESNGGRLFVYLHHEDKIIVCLAINRTEKRILAEVQTLLNRTRNAEVQLFVSPFEGAHEEILEGVDYWLHAVRIYDPYSKRYRMILVGWTKPLDASTWSAILQRLFEKGLDKAL